MTSYSYPFKICDPIHGFVRYDELEKQVIDSRHFQRLRYIHQMGVAHLLYPGATHSRFEHSLGVMELAGRIYDSLLEPTNLVVPDITPKIPADRSYYRKILRLAALCHDIGHLPFSHTAEKSLLPDGGHEKITLQLIQSDEMRKIWIQLGSSAESDIVDILSGKSSFWEQILYKIIAEDNFGADRMDYLLRDGYHTGVSYGRFDYLQLIDTLRILPKGIGVATSGVQSVESLWIGRYMMFARVYHHPKLRVYTHHMDRFMCHHFPKSWDLESYLQQTDYTVLTQLAEKAREGDEDGLSLLKQLEPYREIVLNQPCDSDQVNRLQEEFGDDIFIDRCSPTGGSREFGVVDVDGRIIPSKEASPFVYEIPVGGKPLRLFVKPNKMETIKQFLGE